MWVVAQSAACLYSGPFRSFSVLAVNVLGSLVKDSDLAHIKVSNRVAEQVQIFDVQVAANSVFLERQQALSR